MFLQYFCSLYSDPYLSHCFLLNHRQKKLEKVMDEEGLPDEEVQYAFSSLLQTST